MDKLTRVAVNEMKCGADMDCAVAEQLFGWQWATDSGYSYYKVPPDDPANDGFNSADAPPQYSTLHVDCALVRDRIAKLGATEKFIDELYRITSDGIELAGGDRYPTMSRGALWSLVNASPEQQCRAALLAVIG